MSERSIASNQTDSPVLGSAQTFSRVMSGEIEAVTVAITDTVGQLIGKRCSAEYFRQKVESGFGICDLMLAQDIEMKEVAGATNAGAARGYGDLLMRPDMSTLIASPVRPETAIVLADCINDDGSASEIAPRNILKTQLKRLADVGLGIRMASELEFFAFHGNLIEVTKHGTEPQTPLTRYDADGHVAQLATHDALWSDVQRGLQDVGIGVEYIKFEGGAGQAEVVLTHCEAMQMADKHVLYKQILREIVSTHDMSVSFMAKPFDDQAGSSGHIHYSLYELETGGPIMDGDALPTNLSQKAQHFLAGQIALTGELFGFMAPTINSYKRFTPGLLAPIDVNWGHDDRTAAFRILGRGASRRVECRLPGADVNPYLVFSAMIAAGLYGIETSACLDEISPPTLPRNLQDAAQRFFGSEAAIAAYGQSFHEHFSRYIFAETAAFDSAVTDWERRRYLERI